MGILGVQCCVWALSGTILRFLTDYDGRALPTRVRQHGVSNQSVLHLALKKWRNVVLRFVRAIEPCLINDRAERDPGDHQ